MLPFKKILCPIDFSEPSYTALNAANEIALHFSAELTVIHVVPIVPVVTASPVGPDFNIPMYQNKMESYFKETLKDVVNKKTPEELQVKPVVLIGNAADQIVRYAEDEKMDLIVISTHGETGWRHIIFGSVAEKTVRLSHCPVITIRAPRN